jgi:hypothetical protein
MTDTRTAVRTEIAVAFVLMAAALFALLYLIPNNTEPARSELDISPAFFPMLAAGLVLGLSAAMIVVRLTRAVQSTVELPGPAILVEIVIWCGAGLAIWFVLPVIGFIPTSVIVVVLGGLATGYRRWWVLITLAVVFSLFVDFGAWQIFTVDLP